MLGYFHKEILNVLIFVLPVCLTLFLLPRLFKMKSYIRLLLKFLGIFLLTFTFYFFRNPERKINTSTTGVLSPADGEILSIKENVFENEYFKDKDCEYVIVDVFNYNDNGIKFYLNNGYHTRMITMINKIDI